MKVLGVLTSAMEAQIAHGVAVRITGPNCWAEAPQTRARNRLASHSTTPELPGGKR
jgi:hypothetical protein